jgi:predicted transcriptional regulator of viral defense system
MLTIATPSQCAVDLVSEPAWAGGLSNVATALAELEGLDGSQLAEAASLQPTPVSQRLGWILDFVSTDVDLDPLRRIARRRTRSTLLDPSQTRQGHRNNEWGVIANTQIELDT